MELKDTYTDRTIHEKWESVYRSSKYQDELNDRIMDRIMRLLQPPRLSLFLDAGCGTGDHSARIAAHGQRCIGVDISDMILQDARDYVSRQGLAESVSFRPASLEQLSFEDDHFDFVHCRGVLMHIPDWERALSELCRVLKPGGKLVLIESNLASIEARLVKLARRISRRKSNLVLTPGGWEFWSDRGGQPFVARIANVKYLCNFLELSNMRVLSRLATEFWDINRFPRGLVRNGVIAFNRIWFSWRLPASLSVGNAIIVEKL